jgi:hypothetical protein
MTFGAADLPEDIAAALLRSVQLTSRGRRGETHEVHEAHQVAHAGNGGLGIQM